MELNGMGIGIGVGVGVGSSPPPTVTNTVNPKKKRRTNANSAQATQRTPTIQDFVPPPLSGFGDTVVASNPFDDTPQPGINSTMYNGPQQMHPHHPHHMGNPQMRGMNPMAGGNINPMMPHMGNVNPMNNATMSNHMGHMGNMPNTNHGMNPNMNPMNNMRPNIPQNPMGPMNNHMNMNHMMNSQMTGPTMNSGMNHNLGSPMGAPIGSPINNMSPNHMATSGLNIPPMNTTNTTLPHNVPQPHPNHLNPIRTSGMNRQHNMPLPNMNSTVPNAILGNDQMNNMNMIRSQITNMSNVNMNQRNQMGHMGNAMGNNMTNNISGKSPNHGINIGNAMPQHGMQGPTIGPKPIPESTGKVYPPDQPMIFNQQNPNAPPISPCGICHKECHANDQAIICESGCNFWYHRRCVGLTEQAYNMLMKEYYAEWACDKCLQMKNISLVKFKP